MGDPTSSIDGKGRKKIQCKECGQWYHRLDVHVNKKHDMDVIAYLNKYPGAPTVSDAAHQLRKEASRHNIIGVDPGTGSSFTVFRIGAASPSFKRELSERDSKMVPIHDPEWIISDREAGHLEELSLGIEDDDNVLIHGPVGVGKSTLVMELASICNQPVLRVQNDGDMRKAEFIGEKGVTIDKKTGQSKTEWFDGSLPISADRGYWLLLEEVEAMPGHISFSLYTAMTKPRQLVITGDGGRSIEFDPNFRIIATCNDLPQKESFVDRFGVVIYMTFPSPKVEKSILMKRCKGIDDRTATKMVRLANMVRESCSRGDCYSSISTRSLIEWSRKNLKLKDVTRAARITILNKMDASDSVFVGGLVQRHFGGTT